ncbi:MAG: glycosyltransferase [Polaromonas sp.]|nr:glycosyltransferase [Polaromonas sp.]
MPTPTGFNLIGYATSPMGLGEDLRSFAAMLDYLEIPFSVIDIPTDVQGQVTVAWQKLTQEDYSTSVFFMSAMECQTLASVHPQLFSQPQRKIGYFLWELPDFPDQHKAALQLVDHIWCPTRFVQKAFFAKSRQLTLSLPLPVMQHAPSGRNFRKELKVPAKAFVCLYMFDLHSTVARKNPTAVLRVYLRFAEDHPTAYLFLKVSRWQNLGLNALAWIPKHPRIKFIKDTLSPGELTDLYSCANCYLSLHRSEGFGRTLVEALQNGLHVVSTDFSGPHDYLTPDNALLVDWQRQEVGPNDYPYLSEPSWWADPEEGSALLQLGRAFQRAKKGPNTQGQSDGAMFMHEALASKYRPILKTYLK